MSARPRVLFIYDVEPQLVSLWKDGLWAALKILESSFDITYLNLSATEWSRYPLEGFDFALAWGAFNSSAERFLRDAPAEKKGLCLAGYATPNLSYFHHVDVLFYENKWARRWINTCPILFPDTKFIHAFGVNTQIFQSDPIMCCGDVTPVIDYLSVGSFSYWKHHEHLLEKSGVRLVIGQVQVNNLQESTNIMAELMINGVGVMDMIPPERLRVFYNLAKTVYIGSELMGGGERTLLEARSCGVNVEIAPGNPKLTELLTSPVWSELYYANQLKTGILESIK